MKFTNEKLAADARFATAIARQPTRPSVAARRKKPAPTWRSIMDDDWLLKTVYEASKDVIERGDYNNGPYALDPAEVQETHRKAAEALGLPVAVNLRDRIEALEAEKQVARALMEAEERGAATPTVEISSEAFAAITALPPNKDGRPHLWSNGLKNGVHVRYPSGERGSDEAVHPQED